MAVKYICDLCGEDNAFRVTVTLAISKPGASGRVPKFDKELCQQCFAILAMDMDKIFQRAGNVGIAA